MTILRWKALPVINRVFLCFNTENWERIKALKNTDNESHEIYESAINKAESALRKSWWKDFPTDDKEPLSYMQMGRDLTYVAFAYRFTREARYAGVKDRSLTMASWPKGGYASPEGAGADDKWETHLTKIEKLNFLEIGENLGFFRFFRFIPVGMLVFRPKMGIGMSTCGTWTR